MPWRLGREEWIECACHDLRQHSCSGIGHANDDLLLVGRILSRGNRQRAAARHRVARIDRKVQNGKLELIGICECMWQGRRQIGLDRDFSGQRLIDQVAHAGDQRVQIDRTVTASACVKTQEAARSASNHVLPP